jgi:hypothetical protein
MVALEELSDTERLVWDAFPTGRLVNLLTGTAEDDDPAAGEHWGEDRQVRAEVLLALLSGAVRAEPGQAGVVNVQGARVVGSIGLPGATFSHAFSLNRCYIGDGIDLTAATTASVCLSNCHVGRVVVANMKISGTFILNGSHLTGKDEAALNAYGLSVTGDMQGIGGFIAEGGVILQGATIGGSLLLSGAHLDGKDRPALAASLLTVTGVMACNEGFRADGQITLDSASVGMGIAFMDAHLDGKEEAAVSASHLKVGGDMLCNQTTAEGGMNLVASKIGGLLAFNGAHLNGKNEPGINTMTAEIDSLQPDGAHLKGRDEPALNASGLTVTGDMLGVGGFRADGGVILLGARIGGSLVLSGAHLDGKNRPALTASLLTVTGIMQCDKEFRADGQIILDSASVGMSISFTNAHLDGKEEAAVRASHLKVGGGMLCNQTTAEGGMNLLASKIGGLLAFDGAHLNSRTGAALFACMLDVTGDVSFNKHGDEPFHAEGQINMMNGSVGGNLQFRGARLDGKDELALLADGLSVTRLLLCDHGFRANGGISLRNAKIGNLADEKESWPEGLYLDGLAYDEMTDMPAGVRLDWLRQSPEYRAQPYEQLATYYRRLGHDDQARIVLLAKQRARRRQHPLLLRGWGWLQDALAGYGYAPGRALLLLAGAFVTGWLIFRSHRPPAADPAMHPVFNAALYTLDVLVPAPGLGQASDWSPQGAELALAAGLHILGWLLAITVIAAITRSFSRS